MKKFSVLVVCLFLFAGMAFAQEGFELTAKYEWFSYTSHLSQNSRIIYAENEAWEGWSTTTKLKELRGDESISRLVFEASYSALPIRFTAIAGVGNLTYNYDWGEIQRTDRYSTWSGAFERTIDLSPFSQKSGLGLILGGEFGLIVKTEPLIQLKTRYLWQEGGAGDAKLWYERTEMFGYMAYGYSLQEADIRETSHQEISTSVSVSGKIGKWILAGDAGLVFLKTNHKGTGHVEQRFQDFYYGSHYSIDEKNDFQFSTTNWGPYFKYHLGYEVESAEMFLEGQLGVTSGITAGLNFKL